MRGFSPRYRLELGALRPAATIPSRKSAPNQRDSALISANSA